MDSNDSTFLEQFASTFRFRLGIPKSFSFRNFDIYFLRSEGKSFVQNLYAYNVLAKTEYLVLSAKDIIGNVEKGMTDEEKARKERMREASAGIPSYKLMRDGKSILIPLAGKVYIVQANPQKNKDTPTLISSKELPLSHPDPFDVRLSPDETKMAYVSGNNLHVFDMKTNTEISLTSNGSDIIVNGLPEFVAAEEMDRYQGYYWSPCSQYILYQQNDASNVEKMHIMDPTVPEMVPKEFRYPRPGKNNENVSLYIVSINENIINNQPIQVLINMNQFEYIAKVRWVNEALFIIAQNRHQNELTVLIADHTTGETKELLTEKDSAWVNLDQTVPIVIGNDSFLWSTERNGNWELELRCIKTGKFIRKVTNMNSCYRKVLYATEKHVFFIGGKNVPEQHILKVSLTDPDDVKYMTDGVTTNDCFFVNSVYCVIQSEGLDGKLTSNIKNVDTWQPVGSISDNRHSYPIKLNVELLTIPNDHKFNSALIKPNNFDESKKYPVIVYVYGGPCHCTVTSKGSAYLLNQWIANQGFVVVQIDGRGTPFRGRDFERAIHHNFIRVPMEDQVSGLKSLGNQYNFMDMDRVGIYGWSFGGYFSALSVMLSGDVYHAAFSGAPVTLWEDYDTHYTERYMGLPNENKDGYFDSSVMTHADKLSRPLCIVHGTADDNVYFSHAIKLCNALFLANKDHRFIPLVDFTHMVTDPAVVTALYSNMMRFFMENVFHGVNSI